MALIRTVLSVILTFGLIIFIHELGHFLVARWRGIRVNEFALGMGPVLFRWGKKETQYSLRLLPIGGFVSMEGEDEESHLPGSFSSAPVWSRIAVVLAGAVMNLLLGFVVVLGLTLSEDLVPLRVVHGFSEQAVTEQSGLRAMDKILAVNGRRMYVTNDIIYELTRIKGDSADVLVLRDGEKVELADLRFDVKKSEDGMNEVRLDFSLYGERKTVGNVLRESLLWTLSITRLIFVSLLDLVTGNVPINALSGPVGIIEVIGTAAQVDFYSLFYVLAIITINLGVMNILPLPALDGGRLVFLFVEALTKKRVNPNYEGYVHMAGFVLLILLMLFVTYNDVTKLFTGL